MTIPSVVRQDDVRDVRLLECFKCVLDRGTLVGEEAVAKIVDHDLLFPCALQEQSGAQPGFPLPGAARGKDDPVDVHGSSAANQFENEASAADLDIVGVGPEAEDAKPAPATRKNVQAMHVARCEPDPLIRRSANPQTYAPTPAYAAGAATPFQTSQG